MQQPHEVPSPANPSMDVRLLRNFAIIAHIDHGKSTLSDRLLELTGSVNRPRDAGADSGRYGPGAGARHHHQAHAVRMMYKAKDGVTYQLNLIDTPGTRGFQLRGFALAGFLRRRVAGGGRNAGRGSTDAGQCVSRHQSRARNHSGHHKSTFRQPTLCAHRRRFEKAVGLDATDAIPVSAKTGGRCGRCAGSNRAPAFRRRPVTQMRPCRRLFFDSWFDAYRGVIVLVRVMQGTMPQGPADSADVDGKSFEVESMGVLMPKPVEIGQLTAGEVGFFAATIKNVGDTKIGDTVTDDTRPATAQLPGFEDIKPMVFAGLYTVDSHEHTLLRDALEKLRLNDSSFFLRAGKLGGRWDSGFAAAFSACCTWKSFRSGWSGNTSFDLITTAPGVRYHIKLTDGSNARSG